MFVDMEHDPKESSGSVSPTLAARMRKIERERDGIVRKMIEKRIGPKPTIPGKWAIYTIRDKRGTVESTCWRDDSYNDRSFLITPKSVFYRNRSVSNDWKHGTDGRKLNREYRMIESTCAEYWRLIRHRNGTFSIVYDPAFFERKRIATASRNRRQHLARLVRLYQAGIVYYRAYLALPAPH